MHAQDVVYGANRRGYQFAARFLGEGYALRAFSQDHLAGRLRPQQLPVADEHIEEYMQFLGVRLVLDRP